MQTCRICGQNKDGQDFVSWVKDSFTNFDQLYPGDVICNDCLFWFDTQSTILMQRTGKDKPQKMMNYSHFIKRGEWTPLGKGDKQGMIDMLLTPPFPELAVISVSGQKHLVFRARRNQPGNLAGWVQFEEQKTYVEPTQLSKLLETVQALYAGFSKTEIQTGRYYPGRITKFGVERWQSLEVNVRPYRDTPLFDIAIFLAQRSDDGNTTDSDRPAGDAGDAPGADLERHTPEVQEQVSHDDLGAVRGGDQERRLHQRPGEVCQLPLWTLTSDHRQNG